MQTTPRALHVIEIRRVGPGDDDVVAALATYPGPADRGELLGDPRSVMLVAFDDDAPVGFVLAHDLARRHGDARQLFVYEVDVAAAYRRRGIAGALLTRLAEYAHEQGIRGGFVLTEPDNRAANALYEAVGGTIAGTDLVWRFRYADD